MCAATFGILKQKWTHNENAGLDASAYSYPLFFLEKDEQKIFLKF